MEGSKIIVNGVSMTEKEYKAYKRAHAPKKKVVTRRKKTYSEVDFVKGYIESTMNKLKVLNSILAYDKHAYRQWGTVAKLILSLKDIDKPFNKCCLEITRMMKVFEEIKELRGKRNLADLIYQFTWKLDDVDIALQSLIDGIKKSEIRWSPMGCRECVNGRGKRLGIMTISYKAEEAIKEIKTMNEQLLQIVATL